MALSRRLLAPIVELRENESGIAVLMFAYSFLAMTAYNIIQPITRSRFISSLGADNLPYVLLVSVFIVGGIMQGYSRLGSLLPAKWVVPATQRSMSWPLTVSSTVQPSPAACASHSTPATAPPVICCGSPPPS